MLPKLLGQVNECFFSLPSVFKCVHPLPAVTSNPYPSQNTSPECDRLSLRFQTAMSALLSHICGSIIW